MMPKKVIFSIIFVLTVIAATGFVFKEKFIKREVTLGIGDSQDLRETINEKNTLKDLLTMNQDQECSFVDSDTGLQGNLQIADKKIHGEFTSSAVEEDVSHLVILDENMYIWMEGEEVGLKVPITGFGSQNESGPIDINKEISYKCSHWIARNDAFEVPSEVSFKEINVLNFSLDKNV